MENIPYIEIRPISISPIGTMDIPKYVIAPSQSIPTAVPVTVNLGVPIVNLPGCVESNKENNPKNTALLQDDPNGTLTFCDGSLPSFNPIDFNAEDYLQPSKAPVPPYKPPETDFKTPQIKPPITPKTEIPIIKTEESVKSRLPVEISLFVILKVAVADPLAQEPNELENTELGSQSTAAVRDCSS